jgi:hypothetical protein
MIAVSEAATTVTVAVASQTTIKAGDARSWD